MLGSHITLPISIDTIMAAGDVCRLTQLSQQLPALIAERLEQGVTAAAISRELSAYGRALNQRLLLLAEANLGSPPVPYAFIVAGSMAREEQAALSDQDNGLILANDYCADRHGEYFLKLAEFVSEGLAECGYSYCIADVMATNDKWRQPLSVWQESIANWLAKPQTKSLQQIHIFHDLDGIHGDERLWKALQHSIINGIHNQTLAQIFMASNALKSRLPCISGQDDILIDIKESGITPIIDLVRVYALDSGIKVCNTWERLEKLKGKSKLSLATINDLQQSFDFLSRLRLQHQARQIGQGQAPDNSILLSMLTPPERQVLEQTFATISNCQKILATDFTCGLFPPVSAPVD